MAISAFCISDGTSCIDPKPCGEYDIEAICTTNVSDTSTQYCVWDTAVSPKCRETKCSEAPTTLATDLACSTFKSGCVSTGMGCVNSRSLCSTYTSDCQSMIGSDGLCTSGTDGKCTARTCDSAPIEYTTDDHCNSYVVGCVTNGAGCNLSPLPVCSEYKVEAQVCLLRKGSDGACVGTSALACQVRTCENTPSDYFSAELCNKYLSGCKYDGVKCLTSLQNCASYVGTRANCARIIGSDGVCWAEQTNDSTMPCRARVCNDGESSYNTDVLCAGFMTGCVTNGQGCTSNRQGCATYQGTTTTCKQKIGSDGYCEGTNATTDSPCQARICTNATGASYATNDSCSAYQFGCLSTGSGCVQSATCLATEKQLTCSGTTSCMWQSVCVSNSCSAFTTIGMCTNNQVNGRSCIWNGAICKEKACTDAAKTLASDDECSKYMVRCVYSGSGCLDTTAECTSFIGDSTSCPKFVGNGKKCWSASTVVAACTVRQCSDNTTASSDTDCDQFLSGCVTKLNGCIAKTLPCTSYSGSVDQCKLFKGQSGAYNCYKDEVTLTCRNIKCLDNTTAQSNAECDKHLSGCLTNGQGCVTADVPCSSYPGTSTDICSQFTGNGKQCWWTAGNTCVDRQCSQKQTASSADDCSTFLSGCVYNGSGCQDKTLACNTYTGNESGCGQFFGNGYQCTRKNTCTDSVCSDKTSATTHADCMAFSPLCRYGGSSSCVDANASCSSYSLTQELCNSVTTTTGSICYYFNGVCADKACSQVSAAASQSDCDKFMSGCMWTGTLCTPLASSCSGYSNFTQAACKVAKDLSNNLCFKTTSATGQCEVRACSQVVSVNHSDCYQFLATCTSDGTTCVNMAATCAGYTSFTQTACRNTVLTTKAKCWLETAGPGACTDRVCTQSVASPSSTNCPAHLSSCAFDGTNCVTQGACTSYTNLTVDKCKVITDTNGYPCWKISTVQTDSCIDRQCTDTLTPMSLSACSAYLSKCTYDGTICRAIQTSCTLYTDFTQAACIAAVTTSGEKCYKTYNEVGACESRSCSNIAGGSESACRAHLSTCTYNGSSCVPQQTTCGGYVDTNYLNCQKLSAFNGNIVTPCWLDSGTGTGTCIEKQCIHNTSATSNQQCDAFMSGCVTIGQGCTSNTTPCSSLVGTQDGCSALLGNSKRCKGQSDASGQCSTKYCQDNTTSTADSGCAAFMSGCVTKGIGCISSSQSCSAYSGTQEQCQAFKGAGRTCTNISSATTTTACVERKCSDNTTATTDSDCLTFQIGCITSGHGCTSLTSQCTSFFGTQATCAGFLGNSGNQKCWGTSVSTEAACVIRICTHNTTSTTDSECETFLTGCITNGKGCVVPQLCSSFTGTKVSCPGFSATDKPCRGVSSTAAACKAALCTDAPNTYDTDDQCNKFKPGCVTNGFGCVSSIVCSNYQSQKSCQANSKCLFAGMCNSTVQTTCTSFTNASLCTQATIGTAMAKCTWDSVATGCRNWTCTDALISTTTHAACQALNSTCTTRGSGCITMALCSAYTDQSTCISARSTANDTCVWDTNACRPRACKDAPKALKTDVGCSGYLAGCLTTGYGCISPPYDCTANITQTRCVVDSASHPCLWVNSSNTCINYAKCNDIAKTTFADCQTYSLSCTSDGVTCIPFSLCSYYKTSNSCLIGTDGICGWMTEKSICVKYTSCDQFASQTTSSCLAFNNSCISDGTKCIPKAQCVSYKTQNACISTGIDGYCQWDNNVCRLRQCSDATDNTTTFDSCWQFHAEKTCTSNGTKCVNIANCSTYSKSYCMLGTDGYCTYDDTSSLCRPKLCTDFKSTTSIQCQTTVGLKCVSNGKNCIDISKCSSYTDKEACNGSGTDGICVFTPSANNPLVGSCKLMTSCESATTDTIACAKAPCIISGGVCSAQTCTSQASGGKCNSISSFDKSVITVCVPNDSGQCVKGDAASLTSSLCFELSGRTYSWNPSKQKCEKCVKIATNSTNTTDTGDEGEQTTYGITLTTLILIIFGLIQ